MSPIGEVAWSSVATPRESLTPGKKHFDIAIELSEDEIAEADNICADLIEEARKADPRFPKDDAKLFLPVAVARGPKKADGSPGDPVPGRFLLKAKINEVKRDGSLSTPPRLVDALGQSIAPRVNPGPRSKVRILVDFFTFNTAGTAGVGAGLRGIQIAKLQEEADFGALDPADLGEEEVH